MFLSKSKACCLSLGVVDTSNVVDSESLSRKQVLRVMVGGSSKSVIVFTALRLYGFATVTVFVATVVCPRARYRVGDSMLIDKHFTRHTNEPTPVDGNLSPEGLSDWNG